VEPTRLIRARGDVAVWELGAGEPVLLMHGYYLADVGHWPHLEAPDAVHGIVAAALCA
jgi:pimeloyl-ACP methyl ester carboxylesterase